MTPSKLEVLSEQFYEWLKVQRFSESTRKSYRIYLHKFLNYLETETDVEGIQQIISDHIHSYQTYLYYAKTKTGKPLSVLTQHNALSVVRTFFRFLLKDEYVLFDVTAHLQLPKKTQKLPNVMSEKEIEQLLEKPDCCTPLGFRDRTIMEVLYVTGMRNSELCNLTLYDVNLQSEQLRVRHGKGGKDRILPLGEFALRYLSEYLLQVRPKLLTDESEQALFVSKTGRKLCTTDLTMIIRKYGERANLSKRVTPHSFRHSCATHMLKGGADIRYIQMLLGHASVSATQIYTQVEVDDLKAVHRQCHPRERIDAVE